MKMQGDAIHFINEAFKHCKAIGAIGQGTELLKASDLPDIKCAGQKSGDKVISDKGVVTCRNSGIGNSFNEAFIKAIAMHRHWDRERKEQVPA